MPTFHKNFPFGKGMWIWNLWNCEGGNVDKIIEKCKKYNISYVIIKSFDGENSHPRNKPPQLTKEICDKLHANGIGVYSWSYNYGYNVQREIALTLWSLEQLGVDGHVFDAETEWESLPDPSGAARELLQAVRAKHPDAFLAHAPYPYIDYHTRFAYVEFGRYCDAVMPQVYWGTIGITVEKMVADMFAQWSKWEKKWREQGHADAIKPIIPLGQTYDNPQQNFTQTPEQLTDFISRLAGYGSLNFWDWEHTLRSDLWAAIGNAPVKSKNEMLGGTNNNENSTTTESSTTTPTVLNDPPPANPQPLPENTPVPVETPNVPANDTPSQTPPVVVETGTPAQPASPDTTPVATIPVPVNENSPTTVTIKKDEDHPGGVQVDITTHKAHIDYLIDFLMKFVRLFTGGKK